MRNRKTLSDERLAQTAEKIFGLKKENPMVFFKTALNCINGYRLDDAVKQAAGDLLNERGDCKKSTLHAFQEIGFIKK